MNEEHILIDKFNKYELFSKYPPEVVNEFYNAAFEAMEILSKSLKE